MTTLVTEFEVTRAEMGVSAALEPAAEVVHRAWEESSRVMSVQEEAPKLMAESVGGCGGNEGVWWVRVVRG